MTIEELNKISYSEFLNIIKELKKEEYKKLPKNKRTLSRINLVYEELSSYLYGLLIGGSFASLTALAMYNDNNKTTTERIATITIAGTIVSILTSYSLIKDSKSNQLHLAVEVKNALSNLSEEELKYLINYIDTIDNNDKYKISNAANLLKENNLVYILNLFRESGDIKTGVYEDKDKINKNDKILIKDN